MNLRRLGGVQHERSDGPSLLEKRVNGSRPEVAQKVIRTWRLKGSNANAAAAGHRQAQGQGKGATAAGNATTGEPGFQRRHGR